MNESNVSGKFDEVVGKAKQGLGEAFGNEKLADEGAADEVKGHAKQTWGDVKDAVSDIGDNAHTNTADYRNDTQTHATHDSETLRDKITGTAEHAKDNIGRGLDHLKGDDHA